MRKQGKQCGQDSCEAVLKEASARESIFRSSAQTMSLTELRFWEVLNQNLKGRRGRNRGFGQPDLS